MPADLCPVGRPAEKFGGAALMMDTSFGLARTRFGAGGANRGDDGGGRRTPTATAG